MNDQTLGRAGGETGSAPSPERAANEKEQMEIHPKVRLLTRLRNYLFAGIIVSAPIGLTIYLTLLVVHFVDARIEPLIPPRYHPESYLPFGVPGLGLILMLLFLILVGFVATNVFGRILIRTGERVVARMPVVRSVYGGLKQIFETVLRQSSTAFRQVVLVEYPRRGIWAIAFLTSDTEGEVQRRTTDHLVSVFLPTTPNPTSGFLLLVPKDDVIYLDMTVEEAAKMIISGGVVMPPDRLAPQAELPPPAATPISDRKRQPAE